MPRPCSLHRIAGVVATLGFVLIGGFQVALAAGAPFGVASYGGSYPGKLPPSLRCVSSGAAFVWFFAAFVVALHSELVYIRLPCKFVEYLTIGLAVLMSVSFILNTITPSQIERRIWSPITLLLAVSCIILAKKKPEEGTEQEGRSLLGDTPA